MIIWDDEDKELVEANDVKPFKVARRQCFSSVVPNTTRLQWQDKYGAPNTVAIACPNMDKVIKSRLASSDKVTGQTAGKTTGPDVGCPMTYILEEAVKGQLNQKSVIDAALTALHLGNASVRANRERRRNVIQSMNHQILDMADDDAIYEEAAPPLFGDGFCKKTKERDEELQSLNMATSCGKNPPETHRNFFEEVTSTDNSQWKRPKFQRANRRLPKVTPLVATKESVAKMARIQKPSEPPLMYVALDLPY